MPETKLNQFAERICRISTRVPKIGSGGFTFTQFLIDADEPLRYRIGMRAAFPAVRGAIEHLPHNWQSQVSNPDASEVRDSSNITWSCDPRHVPTTCRTGTGTGAAGDHACPSYSGGGAALLRATTDVYEQRFGCTAGRRGAN